MTKFVVRVNLRGLEEYRKRLESDMNNTTNGPVRKMFRRWSARYRAFLLERYNRYSRGGGNWKKLKPNTILRKGSSAILVDTGTMRAALSPQFAALPGQLEGHGRRRVDVGYGPGYHPKAKMPIERLAEIHQEGQGNNPQRKIIVQPDQRTLEGMRQDAEQALRELGDQTGVS